MMMLKLDHIPFVGRNGGLLRRAFSELGFVCSPDGFYTSPEYPSAVWHTVCVFLESGWFDLLQDSRDGVSDIGTPSGCLYLTDDLSGSLEMLDPEQVTARYSLTRNWKDRDSVSESFQLASLKNSICRLPLAIIQHRWPCDDVESEWTSHPSTASSLEGVYCSSNRQAASLLSEKTVDTSQAINLNPTRFAERFETDKYEYAVSVRVRSLQSALSNLSQNAVSKAELRNRVIAYPDALDCAFEFFE